MTDEEILERHIGREETTRDQVDPERMRRLAALLDRDWEESDTPPPLGHFVLFRPDARESRLGVDGHPMREAEGMLPAISLPRRMWAGSRIRFEAPLTTGMALVRTSRLTKAVAKRGRSGDMAFCTVEHSIRAEGQDAPLIVEEQDLVYREAHRSPDLAVRRAPEPEFAARHTAGFAPGPVELFRYSALTFNSHRIHYDADYARSVEGYRDCVVHGPLLATKLFEHLETIAHGRRIAEFAFRAVSPSFVGEDLTLGAAIDGDAARLIVTHGDGVAVTGEATLGS
ncbi:MaoC family dehydratase N-terminal domain-containing protein [Erythrobacter sp. LQ02-29]|uniref:FAS1-like dehydratase domain-containing protein n=1 Tax=Erythrobacter sp. LQ02-29 TaxID=2920384 RepID=UPI001F4EB44B|nr:MaoC family dehydratase N-terminal domain-containing protein [Erythrobacter sp. LQ02-29]MCP9222092.1 MaoC family dehydratase N-terminal domain-containing protein [Erythrobacter sp. LQ02-29]